MNMTSQLKIFELLRRAWFSSLIIYMIMLSIISIGALQMTYLFSIPFYIFIPGYSLTIILPIRLSKQESILLSVAFSLSLFAGMGAFLKMTINMYQSWVSPFEILSIFSFITFILKTVYPNRKTDLSINSET